jgi:eukaryotic-like serine/threonine-protein kinase
LSVVSAFNKVPLPEVKRLFAEVCDLPSAQRGERLRVLTQDPALIANVLELARASDICTSQATLIAGPMAELLGGAVASEMAVGDRLGAWSLTSVLGQGGMGSVFLADRVDGHFKQQAAVKVLHGIPSNKAREYLAQERQILANLAHPYIAKVIDGGSTPRGRPYLVMAYVPGQQIDEYCRAKQLQTNEILRLYLHVCEPVAYAHQHLVVHCDLKPSNVLIDASGRPVLLDFGIARLINAVDPTGPIKAFTPRYASPEQQGGAPVSTTADVYSLGVMLRELITVSNREIDAILLKATAHDPRHRYASVDAMVADIKNHLDHRLVSAMPATLAYRSEKFVAKRWPQLVAASVFIATVTGFAMQLIASRDLSDAARLEAQRQSDNAENAQREAVRQRDRAQLAELDALNDRNRAQEAAQQAIAERDRTRAAELLLVKAKNAALTSQQDAAKSAAETRLEAEQATEVVKFMESLLTGANAERSGQGDVSALALLDEARKRAQADLKQHPAVRASLMFAVARAYESMGELGVAQTLYRESEALERALSPARPLHLAELLHRMSLAAFKIGEKPHAIGYARESLRLRQAHMNPADEAIIVTRRLMELVIRNSVDRREIEPTMGMSLATLKVNKRSISIDAAGRLHDPDGSRSGEGRAAEPE